MKIKLIAIGKTNSEWLKKGIAEYMVRLGHYIPFEYIEIPDIKNRATLSMDRLKALEESEIEKHFHSDAFIIALDEHGREYSSVEFSEMLAKKMNEGNKQLLFIIGGAFGISAKILNSCHARIALSQMTFSHQMVRLFFVEQLYRAFTILKGEKYHHK